MLSKLLFVTQLDWTVIGLLVRISTAMLPALSPSSISLLAIEKPPSDIPRIMVRMMAVGFHSMPCQGVAQTSAVGFFMKSKHWCQSVYQTTPTTIQGTCSYWYKVVSNAWTMQRLIKPVWIIMNDTKMHRGWFRTLFALLRPLITCRFVSMRFSLISIFHKSRDMTAKSHPVFTIKETMLFYSGPNTVKALYW